MDLMVQPSQIFCCIDKDMNNKLSSQKMLSFGVNIFPIFFEQFFNVDIFCNKSHLPKLWLVVTMSPGLTYPPGGTALPFL